MKTTREIFNRCLTPVEYYKTTDGKVFSTRADAITHQTDIVGELLDGLIPENDSAGFYRGVKQRILLQILEDVGLPAKLASLAKHTTPFSFTHDGEDQ